MKTFIETPKEFRESDVNYELPCFKTDVFWVALHK